MCKALHREHYLHVLWFNEKMLALHRTNFAETSDGFSSIEALSILVFWWQLVTYQSHGDNADCSSLFAALFIMVISDPALVHLHYFTGHVLCSFHPHMYRVTLPLIMHSVEENEYIQFIKISNQ